MKAIRVLLVDDHRIVRAGLRAMLESTGRIDVVGEASSGEEAVARAESLQPDIVIMDLAMPGAGGLRATRAITALGIGAKILVLTVHDEDEHLAMALDAGAAGYLNKSVADTDLIGAIEALLRGHSYLPRRAADLITRDRRGDRPGEPELESLSEQERTVLELYARGFSARQIGQKLFLSPKTVEGYLARAKRKLGLAGRQEIVHFALRAGLLSVGEEE